jgi:hypothetical protein
MIIPLIFGNERIAQARFIPFILSCPGEVTVKAAKSKEKFILSQSSKVKIKAD